MIGGYYCPICEATDDYINSYSTYKSYYKDKSRYIINHNKNCYWYKKNIKHLITETRTRFYADQNFVFKKIKLNDKINVIKEEQIYNPDFSIDWF